MILFQTMANKLKKPAKRAAKKQKFDTVYWGCKRVNQFAAGHLLAEAGIIEEFAKAFTKYIGKKAELGLKSGDQIPSVFKGHLYKGIGYRTWAIATEGNQVHFTTDNVTKVEFIGGVPFIIVRELKERVL